MVKLLKRFSRNVVDNAGWCFETCTRSVHRGPDSFQPLCCIRCSSNTFGEHPKRIRNVTALNTWAHPLLNRVSTGCRGDTTSWLHPRSAFAFGWGPNLRVCEHPASRDIFSFISKSAARVVPLKTGIKALRGVADGSSSTNSCSQIFFFHYLPSKNITFPLGRWEEGGGSVHFPRPLARSGSPASTINPAGIKRLQLEATLTAADKRFSGGRGWTRLLESLLTNSQIQNCKVLFPAIPC